MAENIRKKLALDETESSIEEIVVKRKIMGSLVNKTPLTFATGKEALGLLNFLLYLSPVQFPKCRAMSLNIPITMPDSSKLLLLHDSSGNSNFILLYI